MGVYNPNMEMPRNCTECIEFKEDCDHYWDYYCTHNSRPNDCPLIEIDLIRCVECKHYNGHEKYCEIDHFARENSYCSDGKRRTDYTVFTVNPPKGVEISLKGDVTVFHKNSKMGENVARPTATSSTEVPWWIKGE